MNIKITGKELKATDAIKNYIDTNFPNWKRNKYLSERSKQNLYLKMVNSLTYKLFYLY